MAPWGMPERTECGLVVFPSSTTDYLQSDNNY